MVYNIQRIKQILIFLMGQPPGPVENEKILHDP